MKLSINSFTLKVVAVVAMTFNHIGLIFSLNQYSEILFDVSLWIGKLTYPILAFLLVEGFFHTHSKFNYARNLLIFGVISIIPYKLAFSPMSSWTIWDLTNNILITMFFGLLLLIIDDKFKNTLVTVITLFLFSLLTIHSDWGILGVPTIFIFYSLHGSLSQKVIPQFLMTSGLGYLYYQNYLTTNTPLSRVFSVLGIVNTIPLLLQYNGRLGYTHSWVKWGFYAFYPAHLLLLYIIRLIVFGY